MKAVLRFFGASCLSWCALTSVGYSQSYTFNTLGGSFYYPFQVVVDPAGNTYLADSRDEQIKKITPTGTVSALAGLAGISGSGDGANTGARFSNPSGIALDSAGNLYVSDTGNHTIRKLTRVGTNWVVTTLAGLAGVNGSANGTGTNAQFSFCYDIAVDTTGNLYVADAGNDIIRQVAPIGTNWVVSTIAGLAGSPGSGDGTTSARFNAPRGLTVDSTNNLYVSDTYNHTVRKITPVGTNWVVSTLAGLAGASGSTNSINNHARFNNPWGIAVDGTGSLYVADYGNDLIRKVTLIANNWTVSTLAGSPGISGSTDGLGSAARFNGPAGIALDPLANLYVSDSFNNGLRFGWLAQTNDPSLQLTHSNNNAVASWPLSAVGFELETSPTVSLGASWIPLTNGVATAWTRNVLTTNLSGQAAFFRLHNP